jgi:putative endonuclease
MERMLGLPLIEAFLRASDAVAARFAQPLAPHLELGRRGEEAAFFYLRRQGYIVVALEWRSGKAPGDLDLVAWEGNILCFVEVKTRTSRDFATAESAVDLHKRKMLRRLAKQYLLAMKDAPEATRFDVVSLYFERSRPAEIELFRGAFGWYEKEML